MKTQPIIRFALSLLKSFVISASFFMSLSAFMYVKRISQDEGLVSGVPTLAAIVMLSLMIALLVSFAKAICEKFSDNDA